MTSAFLMIPSFTIVRSFTVLAGWGFCQPALGTLASNSLDMGTRAMVIKILLSEFYLYGGTIGGTRYGKPSVCMVQRYTTKYLSGAGLRPKSRYNCLPNIQMNGSWNRDLHGRVNSTNIASSGLAAAWQRFPRRNWLFDSAYRKSSSK